MVRQKLSITESQTGRGWKGPLWVTQSNPPTEAGSPRAGCTGPCPGRSRISPEKETPQPPWAACSSAPSPSEGRSSSSCSDGTSCASVCAHCPLSCHWAPLERVWPHSPDTHPGGQTFQRRSQKAHQILSKGYPRQNASPSGRGKLQQRALSLVEGCNKSRWL